MPIRILLALLAALALKVASESPFAADPISLREGWDIAIAPFAHAAGLAAGALASALAEALAHRPPYHRRQ